MALQSGNMLCLGSGKMEINDSIFLYIGWKFFLPWFVKFIKKYNPI